MVHLFFDPSRCQVRDAKSTDRSGFLCASLHADTPAPPSDSFTLQTLLNRGRRVVDPGARQAELPQRDEPDRIKPLHISQRGRCLIELRETTQHVLQELHDVRLDLMVICSLH
jgi:hypothetical protein